MLGSRAPVIDAQDGTGAQGLPARLELRSGDIVVYQDHSVARVIGLEPAPGSGDSEAIVFEYAGGWRRLVPVHGAGRLWRYGADGDAVKVDKLDGASWQRRRGPINEAIAQNARALLQQARVPRDDQYENAASHPDCRATLENAPGWKHH